MAGNPSDFQDADATASAESAVLSVLELVAQDIQALPKSALQLVAALVSLNKDIPAWLSTFVTAQLAKRVDLSVVSPAAQAVMRLTGL